MTTTKKITRATFKSFIAKNRERLLVKIGSSFDGMVDGVVPNRDAVFVPTSKPYHAGNESHDFGIAGVWLVGGSRDYFSHYEDDWRVGIRFDNCCGSGVVAVAK